MTVNKQVRISQSEKDKEWLTNLKEATGNLVRSYNHMLHVELPNYINNFPTIYFEKDGAMYSFKILKHRIEKPRYDSGKPLYPRDCINSSLSYTGKMYLTVELTEEQTATASILEFFIGYFPVMTMSDLCYISEMTHNELLVMGEEPYEAGGGFIINGRNRMLRQLVSLKRNYPIASNRSNKKVILMRCSSDDDIPYHITLNEVHGIPCLSAHGSSVNIILIMKALKRCTDKEIFQTLIGHHTSNKNIDRVMNAIRDFRKLYPLVETPEEALTILDKHVPMRRVVGYVESKKQQGKLYLQTTVFPQLKTYAEKFDMLVFMARKYFLFVDDVIAEESTETFNFSEVLTPGQVLLVALSGDLSFGFSNIISHLRKESLNIMELTGSFLSSKFSLTLSSLVNTGNLIRQSAIYPQIPMVQANALSVVAERISYPRYLAHFRSIHKGSRYDKMRTTEYRKLGTEEYGFICPIHTPDGGPCGLLNHLAKDTRLVFPTKEESTKDLPRLLVSLGMLPITDETRNYNLPFAETATVILNGSIIGYVRCSQLDTIADQLRFMKVKKLHGVPYHLEVVAFNPSKLPRHIPALILNLHAHIIVRPVMNLIANKVEYISPLEQTFLNIALTQSDLKDSTTHMELTKNTMLSIIGSTVPFADFNQSPRNIYQCQMMKQSISFAMFNHDLTESKLYRILFPQKPIVRTSDYTKIPLDIHGNGTNAVVAVISYTGYDMEDALIVNKASFNRGFGFGSIYKNYAVELETRDKRSNVPAPKMVFNNLTANGTRHIASLDDRGLPTPGQRLVFGDPFYVTYDETSEEFHVKKYKETDPAFVESVRIVGVKNGDGGALESCDDKRAVITLRYPRNPTIGDKFASRHGQKGIMSLLWPQEDMPFSENGMAPDVIINPHAFPSRMTIGMLVESMAGKAGALHGNFVDASPFQFDEKNTPVDYFGEQLKKAGYNYFGNETLYSGTTGVEMKCDIFVGIVYYQRLRHMVSDKFQARNSQGPYRRETNQPSKGRKVGGGMRFGEMERDAVLGYGASHILRDRMLKCSDYDVEFVCKKCGMLMGTKNPSFSTECSVCGSSDIGLVEIPFPLRYLYAELASVNVKMKFDFEDL